jgi:hypothetical protein
MYFVSYKHVGLIHKIIMFCEKVIKSIHVSFTQLSCVVPPQNPHEALQPRNP